MTSHMWNWTWLWLWEYTPEGYLIRQEKKVESEKKHRKCRIIAAIGLWFEEVIKQIFHLLTNMSSLHLGNSSWLGLVIFNQAIKNYLVHLNEMFPKQVNHICIPTLACFLIVHLINSKCTLPKKIYTPAIDIILEKSRWVC